MVGGGSCNLILSETNGGFWLSSRYSLESPPCGQRGKRRELNQALGISRGGRSTKIHAIVDSKGLPLNFAVTGGQVHDSQVVGDVV